MMMEGNESGRQRQRGRGKPMAGEIRWLDESVTEEANVEAGSW